MKIKLYHRAILLLCFFSNSNKIFAQKKINLDDGWKFYFGNASNPDKDFDYGSILLFHKSNVFGKTVGNPKFVDTVCRK